MSNQRLTFNKYEDNFKNDYQAESIEAEKEYYSEDDDEDEEEEEEEEEDEENWKRRTGLDTLEVRCPAQL